VQVRQVFRFLTLDCISNRVLPTNTFKKVGNVLEISQLFYTMENFNIITVM